MTKPRHSAAGYLRLMQMSRVSLFVFVEGWSDRNVYDRICKDYCNRLDLSFEVRTSAELPDSGSGKQALLAFFEFLRNRRSLCADFQGKVTGALFFIDKDVDELLGTRRRSDHVVYTEYYDLENYAVAHGDLVVAGAGAAGLDEGSVRAGLLPNDLWRQTAISTWVEWIALCLMARLGRASCPVTYRRISQINARPYSPTDLGLLATYAAALQAALGATNVQFDFEFGRTLLYVKRLLRAGEADRVFKGKWYKYFLADDLRRIAGARPINSNGLEERVVDMLKMTLDVTQPWSNRYRESIQRLVAIGLT